MGGSPPQIPRFARNDSIQRRPDDAQPGAAHGGVMVTAVGGHEGFPT